MYGDHHRPLPRPHLTDFWNNRRQESVPFVSKVHLSSLSQTDTTICSHGPLWRTSATIGVSNPCRLFQESIPAARHGCPSTARPHGRSDTLLKQLAWGIRAVCFKSSSKQPVTAIRPRPTPTARSGRFLKQSAPGIRAVCFKSPSRRPVTDVRHGPLSRTSETNGTSYGQPWLHFCLYYLQNTVPF